jgi:hypothetical protein
MIVLAGLVVVGGVVVIKVHDAEQEALRQAAEAKTARAQVADQLTLVKAKEAARLAAQAQATEAGQDAQMSRAELQRANQQLTGALEAARTASAEDKALREKVEGLLDAERRRTRSLEQQRTKMATELR